jgi:hypothetical protein
MPRFFFDLAGPGGVERDDLGVVFTGVEAAYVDACRAVLEISVDMLRDRRDPGGHRFEVRDEVGVLVLEIPFSEVLQPGGPSSPPAGPDGRSGRIKATLGLSRRLRAEVSAELVRARSALETTQQTLRRYRG